MLGHLPSRTLCVPLPLTVAGVQGPLEVSTQVQGKGVSGGGGDFLSGHGLGLGERIAGFLKGRMAC